MQEFGTDWRAWWAGFNAVLIAGVVFLLGFWAGQGFKKPWASNKEKGVVAREEALPQTRGKTVPAPMQALAVSHADAFAELGVRPLPEAAWETAPVAPALNMRQTTVAYEISVSLTGVHPNDLRIRTEQSLLIIQADLKHPATGRTATTEGRLRIPQDARLEALNATYEDGHLHVVIPR